MKIVLSLKLLTKIELSEVFIINLVLTLKLYLLTYYYSSYRTQKIGNIQNRFVYVNLG